MSAVATREVQIVALQTELSRKEAGHVGLLMSLRKDQVATREAVEEAMSHLQEQLRVTYERIAVLETEITILLGRIKVIEDLRAAEKSASDARVTTLEAVLSDMTAERDASQARLKAVGERLKAAVDTVPFRKIARSSHGGYASGFVDLLAKVDQLLVEMYAYAPSQNVAKMTRDECSVM